MWGQPRLLVTVNHLKNIAGLGRFWLKPYGQEMTPMLLFAEGLSPEAN